MAWSKSNPLGQFRNDLNSDVFQINLWSMLVNNTFLLKSQRCACEKCLHWSGLCRAVGGLVSRNASLNEGALRDISKDGCEGDYQRGRDKKISPAPETNQIALFVEFHSLAHRGKKRTLLCVTWCNCDLQSYYSAIENKKNCISFVFAELQFQFNFFRAS